MTFPEWLVGRRLTPADLTAEGNAFTALRWLLATSVMFSHGWDLTQSERGLDPSVQVFGLPIAGIAVFLFFTLSGFLVSGSLAKRGLRDFAVSRALRLVPGLWVMLIVVTLGLGLTLSTLDFSAYLAHPQTWRYMLKNASLVTSDYTLPGVFGDLPARSGVNGSLWTIPQEVRCYIALGVVGAVGALAARRWLLVALLIGIVVQLTVPLDLIPALDQPRRLALSFFLGVAAWQWRAELRWSWPIALIAAAGAVTLGHLGLPIAVPMVAIQIAFAYLVGVAAFCAPVPVKRISRAMPDYSYGIYIYAFPAQQVAVATGLGVNPLSNIAVGFLLLMPFAAASWHFVESPALRLKEHFARRGLTKVSDKFTR